MTEPTRLDTANLDDLIRGIDAASDDPLERLTSAVLTGAHMDALVDHLIGHFVDAARDSGASWTDIGQCLGVTKQAAQKRFTPGAPRLDPAKGFAAFTERARNVLAAAHNDAASAGNPEVTAAHLAAALLDDETSLATLLLVRQGVDAAQVRRAVAQASPVVDGEPLDLVPYDSTARKALELTFRHALRLDHSYIGTEHILLALLDVENGDGPLAAAGVDRAALESDLRDVLAAMTP
ncbi:hypothetical protein nbrc107696_39650 [Gordonia spumicola]|uniref:Clp R domain-containing protein n=1 Tax=Gordonia spumicola TaxID=589161 RepID=A0A7I9VDU4_9ACTN|nr:Clp protease N-terminal domain-containing protein [Gordonia spumicola]GEE03519.1 hypothetical protein nbrc107696_39650 [Gordonia spumicola]